MYTSWLHLMITGLSLLHNITSRMRYKLHIDLGDGEGGCPYAEYSTFAVEGPETKYRLSVSDYTGTAGTVETDE